MIKTVSALLLAAIGLLTGCSSQTTASSTQSFSSSEQQHGVHEAGAGDQDDLFVQDLNDRGISVDKDAAVDMARAACNSPSSGVGGYNAILAMQRRYPQYTNQVASVMAWGRFWYCR